MDEKLYQMVCCPKCKGELLRIEPGLSCRQCGEKFDIIEGILILVDLNNLPPHMRGQVKYFEKATASTENFKWEPWHATYLDRFLENFPDVKNKMVLDCGTGDGYMALGLAKKGSYVVACDLTLKSLLKLKNAAKEMNLADKICFVCCSAEDLPFKDGTFDYFISNAVLEHLPREKQAIEEMGRVSKSRCGLMVTVPQRFGLINPLLWPVNYIFDMKIGHLRRYDRMGLARKLKDWRLRKTYYSGHFEKVAKTLLNQIGNLFDNEDIERRDKAKSGRERGAINIVGFFERQ